MSTNPNIPICPHLSGPIVKHGQRDAVVELHQVDCQGPACVHYYTLKRHRYTEPRTVREIGACALQPSGGTTKLPSPEAWSAHEQPPHVLDPLAKLTAEDLTNAAEALYGPTPPPPPGYPPDADSTPTPPKRARKPSRPKTP